MQDPSIDAEKHEVLWREKKTKQGQSISKGNLFRATFMGPAGLKAWDGTSSKNRKERKREKKQSWNRQGHRQPQWDQIRKTL